MPLEKSQCDECGTNQLQCPECGSNHVTPQDDMYKPSADRVVNLGLDEGCEIIYTHVCWNCGWEEKVTVTISRSEITSRGESADSHSDD